MREHDSQNRPAKLSSCRQSAWSVADRDAFVLDSPWGRSLHAAEVARVAEELALRTVEAGGYVILKGRPVTDWMGVVD
jgi:hypothetical protein